MPIVAPSGFRSEKSTIDGLIYLYDFVRSNQDNTMKWIGIFFDDKKVIDCVDHLKNLICMVKNEKP